MRWAGHVACMRDDKSIKNFGQKPEGKRPLRRPRHKWDDNIKTDFGGLRQESFDNSSGLG
jgi:hypothetical protein